MVVHCFTLLKLVFNLTAPTGASIGGSKMKSTFMPMGFRSRDGYLVSDKTVQELQKFFATEIELEVSPSDILRIVDAFKSIQEV